MRVCAMIVFGWLVLVVAGDAALYRFVAPEDGPVAFRRDRLPLNVGQMRRLSRDLVVVAGAMDGRSAEGRRAAAQALALALALHPTNTKARLMLREWRREQPMEPLRGEPLMKVAVELDSLFEWLVSDAAGVDGQSLADCLSDLLEPSGLHRDTGLGKWSGGQERGSWDGWVADLEAFRPPPQVKVPELVLPVDGGKSSEGGGTVDDKWSGFQLKLKNALTVTPMWQRVGRGKNVLWELAPHPLTVSAVESGNDKAFRLRLGRESSPMNLQSLESRIANVLSGHFKGLPRGVEVTVTSDDFEASLKSKKDLSMSAPMAVLCAAVLTGREPVAKVIGAVDRQEKLQTGKYFWSKLRSLNGDVGGRLVVAGTADEYLKAMLTAGEPDFFLKHEVMVADDVEGLLDRALVGGSQAVQLASEQFKVIREYAEDEDVMTYIRNSHVRKRLQMVVDTDPGHASAKMLLVLGDGKRPDWLPRSVLLEELERITRPAASIGVIDYEQQYKPGFVPPQVNRMADDLQAEIQRLERLSDASDYGVWATPASKVHTKLTELVEAFEIGNIYDRRTAVVQVSRELYHEIRTVERIVRR